MSIFSFDDHETDVALESDRDALADDLPFRLLLMGDWSGRGNRSGAAKSNLSERRPVEIDRDNFDEVLKKFDVRISLNFSNGDAAVPELRFRELDDFHPDRIFQQVPFFSDLHRLRKRLMNSQTFEQAAAEARSLFGMTKNNESEIENRTSATSVAESSENLLDQILSRNEKDFAPGQTSKQDELSLFLGKLVKPHLVQTDENEQLKLVAAVDEASGNLMRTILHHPHFQALEAAWRAAYFLVRRIETGVDLKIYLLDSTKNELVEDLKNAPNLADSEFYKILAGEMFEPQNGEQPWAAACGNYAFSSTVEDVAALMRIAKIGEATETPFISQSAPDLLGIENYAEMMNENGLNLSEASPELKLWTTLRSQPEAAYIGLAAPPFLIRLPYGAETDPTETFSFEEFQSDIVHGDYLWASSSFVCALLLAQTFSLSGWETNGKFLQEVEGLPLHIRRENGETKIKPPVEVALNLSVCEKLLDHGLMPLISFRDSDRVRIARFQSIALPLTLLRGKWTA